jgi:hypothetical protein
MNKMTRNEKSLISKDVKTEESKISPKLIEDANRKNTNPADDDDVDIDEVEQFMNEEL